MKVLRLSSHAYTEAAIAAAAISGGAFMGVGSAIWPEPYPEAEEGIELSPRRDIMLMDGVRVPVHDDLLFSNNPEWVLRQGSRVTILQASVEVVGGMPMLVEPKPDERDALVKLELSGYPFFAIRYLAKPEQVIARAGREHGLNDEHMLARLQPFDPLKAERTDQKYIFWGETRVREELTIRYDGRTVAYDKKRLQVPSLWRSIFG